MVIYREVESRANVGANASYKLAAKGPAVVAMHSQQHAEEWVVIMVWLRTAAPLGVYILKGHKERNTTVNYSILFFAVTLQTYQSTKYDLATWPQFAVFFIRN